MGNNMPELTVEQKTYELYGNRSFQDINSGISGRSVVIREDKGYSKKDTNADLWPYSLSDYLKDYIGRMMIIEYVFNNSGYRRKGRLKIVGTNFVGINTSQSGGLLLLELGTVKSINIID